MPRIVLLLFGISALCCPINALAADRPNFVIFLADDMAWNDCGAYGHPNIRTPNIDRLAAEGMRFDRAFLTCSSCSPSRCSILTGRYPHATGAAELHMPLPAEQTVFAKPLGEAGYYTAALGKWHLGPGPKPQFDVVKEGGGDGAYGHWLPTLEERPKDQPFFFWLATTDPHRGYRENCIPEPHSADDAVVPPYLPDVAETREDLALYYDEIGRLDSYVGRVLDLLDRQGVLDNTFVLFLSDNGRPFPRCKTTVLDSGVRTPFIVRFPSQVKPGTVTGSIVSSVDIGPTILELAGLKPLDTFQGVSFAAMLEDPKAETRQYAISEHNWHDYRAFERGVRSKRFTYVYNGLPEETASPPADAVTSVTYRAMQRLRDEGQLPPHQMTCFTVPTPVESLFDVEQDPHSLTNLAGDPTYGSALAEMRRALSGWKRETADFRSDPLTTDQFDRETGERTRPKPR